MAILDYHTNKSKTAYGSLAQLVGETIIAIKTVQSLTREETIIKKYADIIEQPLHNGRKNACVVLLRLHFQTARLFW